MGDRPGSDFRVRTSEDKVCRKDVLVCEGNLCSRKLSDVSGPGLGEAGRYRMVSEPTLTVSRTDVAHGPLALDVWDVTKRGRSWLGIDRRGRRNLKG